MFINVPHDVQSYETNRDNCDPSFALRQKITVMWLLVIEVVCLTMFDKARRESWGIYPERYIE